MPAHLRDLELRCQYCGGRATVELRNTFNASLGYYCRTHGAEALKNQQVREAVRDEYGTD